MFFGMAPRFWLRHSSSAFWSSDRSTHFLFSCRPPFSLWINRVNSHDRFVSTPVTLRLSAQRCPPHIWSDSNIHPVLLFGRRSRIFDFQKLEKVLLQKQKWPCLGTISQGSYGTKLIGGTGTKIFYGTGSGTKLKTPFRIFEKKFLHFLKKNYDFFGSLKSTL